MSTSGQFQVFSLYSPVKLNLALHVVGQRADGYHLLDSLAAFCEDGDRLTFLPSQQDRFSITGPFAKGLNAGADNLLIHARDALRAAFPDETPPLYIILEKNLPVSSGIGGGSGDAAAALLGLCRFWQLDCPFEHLLEIGLKLGADVPMCLYGMNDDKALHVGGIGEDVAKLNGIPALNVVLANPGVGVATPRAFSALANKNNPPLVYHDSAHDFTAMLNVLKNSRNDLLAPALEQAPIIADVLSALDESGAAFSQMSGSGATCFGVFEDAKMAACAAQALISRYPHWFVLATKTKGQ